MSSTSVPISDLSNLLTPSLYHSLVNVQFPWPISQPLNFSTVGRFYFLGEGDFQTGYSKCAVPALKALSTFGSSKVPNLMQYLPNPEDKDFPIQALGLILLLDQAPRALREGTDVRYVFSYFDILTQRLCRQLFALPTHLRPDNLTRWTSMGFSYDHALNRHFWFIIPLVHSEEMEDHEFHTILLEKLRVDVESRTLTTDPYRSTQAEDSKDTIAFSRIIRAGPPDGHAATLASFSYWVLRLLRVHTPIIAHFGRYPYRCGDVGSELTGAEETYLKATDYFAVGWRLDDGEMTDSAKAIRADVMHGVWRPLELK
ncbi:hypothetical protein MMC12_005871 [Toensbergia leucococca]|nr:hypothetical protein [Toensbergia leucococca]